MRSHQTLPATIIDQLRAHRGYLKTTEMMELLGVTRATLCGWVRDGILSATRIGKENKFDPSVVAQWLTDRSL